MWQNGVIVLPCGQASVRFRPALTVACAEIDEAIAVLRDVFTGY